MTWGIRRSVILLPVGLLSGDLGVCESALRHEQAHIARWDWVWNLLAETVCALSWFQPGAWWLHSRMRFESERACDDRVLLSGIAGPDYATHLLEIARCHRQALVRRRQAMEVFRTNLLSLSPLFLAVILLQQWLRHPRSRRALYGGRGGRCRPGWRYLEDSTRKAVDIGFHLGADEREIALKPGQAVMVSHWMLRTIDREAKDDRRAKFTLVAFVVPGKHRISCDVSAAWGNKEGKRTLLRTGKATFDVTGEDLERK